MTRYHGGSDVVTVICPVYRCGGYNVISRHQRFEDTTCEHCCCPMWPMEMGYTGNERSEIMEFARTHDRNGNPRKR
jgi:Zn-finger protein